MELVQLVLGVVVVRLEILLGVELLTEALDFFLELDEFLLDLVVLFEQLVVGLLEFHLFILELTLDHLAIDFLLHHAIDLLLQLLDLLHVHVYRVAASDIADILGVVGVKLLNDVSVFLVLVAARIVDGVSCN